jgi:hypothetical protein
VNSANAEKDFASHPDQESAWTQGGADDLERLYGWMNYWVSSPDWLSLKS